MERKTYDLWVGIFVIVGFLALLFLGLQVGGFGEERSTKTLSALLT